MKKTPWKLISPSERMRVTYGFDREFARKYVQAPYFSITAETERKNERGRWVEDSGGCMHDEVAKHFPELESLIKWHLMAEPGLPTHYVANAIYWAEFVAGVSEYPRNSYDPDPLEAFKSTVVFGAVASDQLPEFEVEGEEIEARRTLKDSITRWCEARLPALQAAFNRAMEEVGK